MARLPWRGKDEVVAAAEAPASLPRPVAVEHHWLALVVVRQAPAGPVPVPGARILVRAFSRGAQRPQDPVARGTTGEDGSVALLLPTGRYAITASHEGEARGVTVTLEHAGRAVIALEGVGRRAILTTQVTGPDGAPLAGARVEVRHSTSGALAADGVTDEHGRASLSLPPGAYEVRVGAALAKTYVDADTILRLDTEPPDQEPPVAALSRYAQRARAAVAYVAPFDVGCVRDDAHN